MEWAVSLLKSYSSHIKIDFFFFPFLDHLLWKHQEQNGRRKPPVINNRSGACSSFALIWAAGYGERIKRTMQACFWSSNGTAVGQGTVSAFVAPHRTGRTFRSSRVHTGWWLRKWETRTFTCTGAFRETRQCQTDLKDELSLQSTNRMQQTHKQGSSCSYLQ